MEWALPSGQCRRTIAGLTARDKPVPTPIGLRGLRDQRPSAKLCDSLDPCRGLSTTPVSIHAPPWSSIPESACIIAQFPRDLRGDFQARRPLPSSACCPIRGSGAPPLSVLLLDGHAKVIPLSAVRPPRPARPSLAPHNPATIQRHIFRMTNPPSTSTSFLHLPPLRLTHPRQPALRARLTARGICESARAWLGACRFGGLFPVVFRLSRVWW